MTSGLCMVSPGTDAVMLADQIAASTLKGTHGWIDWAKRKPMKDDPRMLVWNLWVYDE